MGGRVPCRQVEPCEGLEVDEFWSLESFREVVMVMAWRLVSLAT